MSAVEQYIRPKDVDRRATRGQRLLWRIETLAWDGLYWGPVKLLSPERASDFGGWVFKQVGRFLSQHKTMLRNLRLAFPSWSENEIQATALKAWESAGRTAGELPHLPKINPYAGDRVEVVGAEHLDAIRESGRGAVLVSGHFANWEVMAAVICRRPLDCLVTYRALNNPHIDRRLNHVRHAYGIDVLAPKGVGTREVMRALSNNRSVAFLNDQKFNGGLAVPFFGHDAMTAQGPSRLALKYNVPVVPVSTVRTGPARFRVTVHAPLKAQHSADEERDVRLMVEQITAFIERNVRAQPEQWFWMHRRWPKEAWRAADAYGASA
ncbi:MAG: lysophospholipid acyltransferase family protein [Pseudomonadota bacterium]